MHGARAAQTREWHATGQGTRRFLCSNRPLFIATDASPLHLRSQYRVNLLLGCHIFVDRKTPWFDISGRLPRLPDEVARTLVRARPIGDNRRHQLQRGGSMRRAGPNSFTEIYFAGCNPSFVETSDGYVMIDSPQQPIDAVRWRERMEEKAPIRYLINTEPHGDHISGNAYFPNVTVVGQVKLQECFERYLYAFGSLEEKRERFKETDPDSVWLVGHPDYPAANPPKLTFTDALTLKV